MERMRILLKNAMYQKQEFEIIEYETHIELCAYLTPDIEQVDIPPEINGKPVTAIGDGCFFDCCGIKKVSFPETITTIGEQAFALCKGLTVVVLPDSVIEIGHYAFRDCSGLKKVLLPKNLKRLPIGMFAFCHLHDSEIILPEGLEIIKEYAFGNAGVFNLLIPDSVRQIGVGAFNGGPNPITKLPYDQGWFSKWPYGEVVIVGDSQGKITGLNYLERNCERHEVTIESEIKSFFYPCDYLDGNLIFVDEKNQQTMGKSIKRIWESENELSDAYKIRDTWRRGFV